MIMADDVIDSNAPSRGIVPTFKKRKETARLSIRDDGRPRRGEGSSRPKRLERLTKRRLRRKSTR